MVTKRDPDSGNMQYAMKVKPDGRAESPRIFPAIDGLSSRHCHAGDPLAIVRAGSFGSKLFPAMQSVSLSEA